MVPPYGDGMPRRAVTGLGAGIARCVSGTLRDLPVWQAVIPHHML
jgi:hypothetical protein